ncbi:MAG: DinB family protein [Acidobacteria bacterium]|nr:DinB family protein [Acidobacteriota bacterium]
MKNFLILGLALVSCAPAQTLQQGERDRAMSHLHSTRKLFLDSLVEVTPEQWNWKPAPDVWSIAEVAEHIAVSEQSLFQLVKKVVNSPVPEAAAMAKVSKSNDEKILAMLVDRSKKAQAPEFLQPKRRFANAAELIEHFKKDRDATIEYVQTTQDALRAHATPHPVFQMMDAYQWILLISGHSERHTLQLNEVKTKPGFPK